MTKAFRYLKPFWLSVIAIVALVFAQVQADLALPDYMSRIVTYGIQYGGITSPLSEVLSTSTVSHMKYFMSEADLETFTDTYQEVSSGDLDFPESVTSADSVFILKDAAQDTEGIQKAFLIASVMNVAQGDTDPDAVWAMLEGNPAMAEQIMSQAQEQLKDYTEDNLNALRILMVKNEYASLGMDTEKIQNDYILHEGLIMLGIALLTVLMDAATANNTLAIIISAPIARDISDEFGVPRKTSASLLDTCSCITQGVIPYGAQLLVAANLTGLAGFSIIPLMFYPFILAACVAVSILRAGSKAVRGRKA